MRIGLLSDTYLPIVNGVVNFVRLHKQTLEQMGHECWVIAPGARNEIDRAEHIVRFRALPLGQSGYYAGFPFSAEAQAIVRSMDVLHTQHPGSSAAIALQARRRWGTPVVVTNHTRYDLYVDSYAPFLPQDATQFAVRKFVATVTNRADVVVAPSASYADVMRGWGVTNRIEVIPNGVDLQAFRHPAVSFTRAQVNLPEADVIAVFVGRMAAEKSVDRLLRLFQRVYEGQPDAFLLLIGGGPLLDTYRRLASELGLDARVQFTGALPYEQVAAYLHLADVFATASTTEVHPLTVLEAMAAGLPVVGIHSPGIVDTLVDGENGLMVEDDDAAFVDALGRALARDDLRRQLAVGAGETSAFYDIHTTSGQLVRLYEEIVGRV